MHHLISHDSTGLEVTKREHRHCDRRTFLAAALGGAALLPAAAQAQQAQVTPVPTPRDWSGQQPVRYPAPDIVALDNRFRRYIVGNTTIHRLYTGTLWAEGPAWNGVGRYLVWSDIPNNVQLRRLEEDSRVLVRSTGLGVSQHGRNRRKTRDDMGHADGVGAVQHRALVCRL
jgi:hypothetical protein